MEGALALGFHVLNIVLFLLVLKSFFDPTSEGPTLTDLIVIPAVAAFVIWGLLGTVEHWLVRHANTFTLVVLGAITLFLLVPLMANGELLVKLLVWSNKRELILARRRARRTSADMNRTKKDLETNPYEQQRAIARERLRKATAKMDEYNKYILHYNLNKKQPPAPPYERF